MQALLSLGKLNFRLKLRALYADSGFTVTWSPMYYITKLVFIKFLFLNLHKFNYIKSINIFLNKQLMQNFMLVSIREINKKDWLSSQGQR